MRSSDWSSDVCSSDLVEIRVVDPGAGNEGVDRQRLVAVGHGGRDLVGLQHHILALRDLVALHLVLRRHRLAGLLVDELAPDPVAGRPVQGVEGDTLGSRGRGVQGHAAGEFADLDEALPVGPRRHAATPGSARSEEHTSELQSLMRNSYAVFCLKKKKKINNQRHKKTINSHNHVNKNKTLNKQQYQLGITATNAQDTTINYIKHNNIHHNYMLTLQTQTPSHNTA